MQDFSHLSSLHEFLVNSASRFFIIIILFISCLARVGCHDLKVHIHVDWR